jgi:acyl-CoA thioesterase I
MYYRVKLLLLLTIVALSACKKESMTQEDLGPNSATVNIPANPANDPARPAKDTTNKVIVVIGSSTAAGFGASSPDSCWVGRLRLRIKGDKKKIRVINLGIGGYTTYQLLPTGTMSDIPRRPKPDTNANVTAALKYQPDLVVINLPSNDIGANFRDDEILKNYRTIVRLIASARSEFVITGTQPRNFPTVAQRNRLKILNDKLSIDYPQNISDYLKKLSTPTYAIQRIYGAGDGVHLNNRGHDVIYRSVIASPIFKSVAGY